MTAFRWEYPDPLRWILALTTAATSLLTVAAFIKTRSKSINWYSRSQMVSERATQFMLAFLVAPVGITEVHQGRHPDLTSLSVGMPLLGIMIFLGSGGHSWKDEARVLSLFHGIERTAIALPVQIPHSTLTSTALRGSFLVLTDSQVTAFTYNRIADIVTGATPKMDRATCSARWNRHKRLLTLESQDATWEFTISIRELERASHFVGRINES
ncbi:hypothetical protein [Streptomyces sp. YIM 130001]|uniref:hypothetical protein n=1 Tax=Streptomyces sp. YIM 130001 TaxID=2259644 RepID=UPI0013C41FBE|nr:hypothetical protein [Streptomyces sp. YIM 130001]